MEKLKELFKTKTKLMLIATGVVLLLILAIVLWLLGVFDKKADPSYILMQLKKTSTLKASEMDLEGKTTYTDDGGIKFLTKGGFIMEYHCIVEATIDLKEAEVSSNSISKTVTVTIPKAKVGNVYFDKSKTKFYDEKIAIFDFDDKDDLNRAYEQAEKEVKKLAKEKGILESAQENSGDLIKELVTPLIPKNYEIKVKMK